MTENKIARKVIGAVLEVHKALRPDFLKRAYKLTQSGLRVEKAKEMPLKLKGVSLDCGFRMDLLDEQKLVIERKSVQQLNDIHRSQVLTYLRLGGYTLGLLINFNVKLLKHRIQRVILAKR